MDYSKLSSERLHHRRRLKNSRVALLRDTSCPLFVIDYKNFGSIFISSRSVHHDSDYESIP